MFIEDWNSFYEQAEQLFRNDPLRTRYVLKYKHATGKLVLKVTDDRVVRPIPLLVSPHVKRRIAKLSCVIL